MKASQFKGSPDVVQFGLRKKGGLPREPFCFLLNRWYSLLTSREKPELLSVSNPLHSGRNSPFQPTDLGLQLAFQSDTERASGFSRCTLPSCCSGDRPFPPLHPPQPHPSFQPASNACKLFQTVTNINKHNCSLLSAYHMPSVSSTLTHLTP